VTWPHYSIILETRIMACAARRRRSHIIIIIIFPIPPPPMVNRSAQGTPGVLSSGRVVMRALFIIFMVPAFFCGRLVL